MLLETNFVTKVAQISGYFLNKHHFYVKTAMATFGATFGKFGYFLLQHLVAPSEINEIVSFSEIKWSNKYRYATE